MMLKILLLALFFISNVYSSKVDITHYIKDYTFEWDYILSEDAKDEIKLAYLQGKDLGLAWTFAGMSFLGTRGSNITISVNIRKSRFHSYDCGRFGINTVTFYKYSSVRDLDKLTRLDHMHACLEVIKDPMYASDIARYAIDEGRDIFGNDWRMIWNWYDTGRNTITGEYTYKIEAAIKVLKTRIPVNNIFMFMDNGIPVLVQTGDKSELN